mmetsp:Transcript_24540/g.55106  ORF Transcript_24540/g.55106 Transcript_24540/m.55106 type:complete len:255 (+) Transcript_24540:217-981(+)
MSASDQGGAPATAGAATSEASPTPGQKRKRDQKQNLSAKEQKQLKKFIDGAMVGVRAKPWGHPDLRALVRTWVNNKLPHRRLSDEQMDSIFTTGSLKPPHRRPKSKKAEMLRLSQEAAQRRADKKEQDRVAEEERQMAHAAILAETLEVVAEAQPYLRHEALGSPQSFAIYQRLRRCFDQCAGITSNAAFERSKQAYLVHSHKPRRCIYDTQRRGGRESCGKEISGYGDTAGALQALRWAPSISSRALTPGVGS